MTKVRRAVWRTVATTKGTELSASDKHLSVRCLSSMPCCLNRSVPRSRSSSLINMVYGVEDGKVNDYRDVSSSDSSATLR